VTKIIKNIIKFITAFLCEQYLLIFFVITIGYKLYYFNTYVLKVTWPDSQYQDGIMFGYITLAIIFSPLLFVKKRKNIFAIFLAIILSILIFIDNVYFSYFASLPTAGLISSMGQASDVGPAIADLLHPWLLLYFVDIVIAIISLKYVKLLVQWLRDKYTLPTIDFKPSVVFVLAVFISFLAAVNHVGYDKLSEVVDRGYDTVSTSQYYGIMMAHAIDVARFIKEETSHLSPTEEADLAKWVNDNKSNQVASNLSGVAKNKNIIMIQVESLGGFVINQKINNKEITPNLNKLAATSQYFPNNRFMIGGGHTSDSDFVANTSYYPLTDASVFVLYGRDDFTSLPKTLVSSGYSANAYHGYNRNFWNRDTALSSLGYQKFYAADSFSKGSMINLGLNDGTFLSETADFIKEQTKPSFSFAITLTSHVPFATTSETKDLGLHIDDYPNQVGGYLENINYTDRMLGSFFDKLKANGLYDDSLIVVYGDHVPVLTKFSAGTISYDPETVQGKEVPLIIKLPNETEGKTYENKGTNLDIMPTILDLAGVKTTNLMFGQSLFASGDKSLNVCTDQLVVFSITGDCKADLKAAKLKSAKIIRYNQFDNVNK
jgi:uncharacterized sulfatase